MSASSFCSLADHQQLILPSSADLVSAFSRDLAQVSAIFAAQNAKPTRCVMFYALTGVTLTWDADADYSLIGFLVSGTGNSWFFGSDNKNPAIIGTSTVYLDTKFAGGPLATNETPAVSNINIPIPKGTRLYLVNQTAGSMALTAYLQ